ncbi:hypothetical protein F511_26668 [Dorcoceras hygrometricum]|uniref:Uncharacterized protein n=1 Tax=Dorcoceras hygrometricum TaxID=472368 RepID=A0A2Z7BPZ0_9LAMI|nr:hypothetical protein F511_26668 [Dorcoceras hygrometricum]
MGIDQLKFQSVQLGYLKIPHLGNTDPNNKSRKRKYEVKPQYEEPSKQQIMRHAINQCYEIHESYQKNRTVSHHSSVVFRHNQSVCHHSDDSVGPPGTTNQSAGHNVALSQLREKVIDEIVSFFSSFSLRHLAVLGPLSDIAAKEEHILVWAETDSLQTAVNRRLYIVSMYREMLLRKFLEARNKNFKSGQPTTIIDLQILEMLSDAHRVTLEELKEQMRVHKLEWTRPVNSRFFEGAERDRGAFIARSNTNIISTCWIRRLLKVYGVWKVVEDVDRWIRYRGFSASRGDDSAGGAPGGG